MTVLLDRFAGPWTVFDELAEMQDQFNRMFRDDAGGSPLGGYPALNVWTSKEGVVIEANLPGIDPEKIEISVQGDEMVLKGERPVVSLAEGERYHGRERFAGAFSRTIRLPFRAEPSGVRANYKDGVLRIHIPQAEADKPRQVSIEVA